MTLVVQLRMWLAGVLVLAGCNSAPIQEGNMLAFTGGSLGIADDVTSGLVGVECRFGEKDSHLIPSVGISWSDDGAYYFSVEARHNFWIDDRWVFTPSLGAGYFDESPSLDLGGDLEFRTGFEITYRTKREWRMGLSFFHLSNAGMEDRNPGTEALAVVLTA